MFATLLLACCTPLHLRAADLRADDASLKATTSAKSVTSASPQQEARFARADNSRNGEVLGLSLVEKDAIRIDGYVDESAWLSIPPITAFRIIEPDTLAEGRYATELRLAYNRNGIYVSAVMHQPADTLVRRLTGRDQRDNRDSLSVTLDTSGEGRYGFWFGINLGDSLMDGTVLPERSFSNEWDGPWYGRTQMLDDGWSAELYIPWGTVSMPASADVRRMGIYVSRKVAHLDERWAWPPLPSATK